MKQENIEDVDPDDLEFFLSNFRKLDEDEGDVEVKRQGDPIGPAPYNPQDYIPEWEKTRPTLVMRFADNGEFSHWELVGKDHEVLWSADEDHPLNKPKE